MLSAIVYVIRCSARNRVRRRLERLREPRYLIGALVGAAYLYFAIFGRRRLVPRAQRTDPIPPAFFPAASGAGPAAVGLVMSLAAAVSLLLPIGSGLLALSRTETEFLLAAPLSSRALLLYRLLRSQAGVLFSAFIVALTYPLATPAVRLQGFIGMWLVLSTVQLFFAGVVMTRVRPVRPSPRTRLAVWLPRGYLTFVFATVGLGAYAALHAGTHAVASASDVAGLLLDTASSGWPRVALWPFAALTAPLFATSASSFIASLPGAVFVAALVAGWVLSADEAFEALIDQGVQGEDRADGGRRGYRVRAPLWPLAARGAAETLFVWKTTNQIVRGTSRRTLFRLVLVLVWVTFALLLFAGRGRGVTQMGAIAAAMAAAFAVAFGPQMLRADLRQDLQHLELLKTWPVHAASVVRGQIAGAAVVMTTVAWVFGGIALVLAARAFPAASSTLGVAGGIAALVSVPALILAQYTVHNAAALLFPAWFAGSGSRPRGIDAMGQRIILLAGTWLVLLVAIVPGGLVAGALWYVFEPLIGAWILIPDSIAAAALVGLEVWLAGEALGPVYEALDLTSVEKAGE